MLASKKHILSKPLSLKGSLLISNQPILHKVEKNLWEPHTALMHLKVTTAFSKCTHSLHVSLWTWPPVPYSLGLLFASGPVQVLSTKPRNTMVYNIVNHRGEATFVLFMIHSTTSCVAVNLSVLNCTFNCWKEGVEVKGKESIRFIQQTTHFSLTSFIQQIFAMQLLWWSVQDNQGTETHVHLQKGKPSHSYNTACWVGPNFCEPSL